MTDGGRAGVSGRRGPDCIMTVGAPRHKGFKRTEKSLDGLSFKDGIKGRTPTENGSVTVMTLTIREANLAIKKPIGDTYSNTFFPVKNVGTGERKGLKVIILEANVFQNFSPISEADVPNCSGGRSVLVTVVVTYGFHAVTF